MLLGLASCYAPVGCVVAVPGRAELPIVGALINLPVTGSRGLFDFDKTAGTERCG